MGGNYGYFRYNGMRRGSGGARSRSPDPTWPPDLAMSGIGEIAPRRNLRQDWRASFPGHRKSASPRWFPGPTLLALFPIWQFFYGGFVFLPPPPLALLLALVLVVLVGWRCFGVGP